MMSETFTTMHHVLMDIADYFRERCRNAAPGSAEEKRFCVYVSAITDTDRMLKGQEPRVLTLEEVRDEYEVVWLETVYSQPEVFLIDHGETNAVWLIGMYGVDNEGQSEWRTYKKNWRCWSSKPTEEQREAVKWDT